MRERILATVRIVEVDAYGCPATDPVSADPAMRPEPAADLRTLTGVRSISVCRYLLADSGELRDGGPGLFSSSRLAGRSARSLLRSLAQAPPDRGLDNTPASCPGPLRYARNLVVLLVDSGRGRSRVHVIWNGCDHNGVDDGVRVRRLTQAVRLRAHGDEPDLQAGQDPPPALRPARCR